MNFTRLTYAFLALVVAGASSAAVPSFGVGARAQLPEFKCENFRCVEVPASSEVLNNSPQIQPTSTVPVIAAPPAGQRLLWHAVNYPMCQNVRIMNPQPTFDDPYEYVLATDVPVPLGSTHASLASSFEVKLAGGPAGAGSDVGKLEIKRSSAVDWNTVHIAYAYTLQGSATPAILYGTPNFTGLVNLADLPDGSGVPVSIDVRMAVYPVYTSSFTTPTSNWVCQGKLEVTF